MKNPELFHKTIGILVNAYLNDTLLFSDTCACAVGNLVAGNMGYKITKLPGGQFFWDEDLASNWEHLVWSNINSKLYPSLSPPTGKSIAEAESTGYTVFELTCIENSFLEGWNKDQKITEKPYNGLMAVVEVLCDIHKMDLTSKEEAKALFVKAA